MNPNTYCPLPNQLGMPPLRLRQDKTCYVLCLPCYRIARVCSHVTGNHSTHICVLHVSAATSLEITLLTSVYCMCLQPRHWKSLYSHLNKSYNMAHHYTLNDVVSLGLLQHRSVLASVVTRAQNEYDIQLTLEKLQQYWQNKEFQFVPHTLKRLPLATGNVCVYVCMYVCMCTCICVNVGFSSAFACHLPSGVPAVY